MSPSFFLNSKPYCHKLFTFSYALTIYRICRDSPLLIHNIAHLNFLFLITLARNSEFYSSFQRTKLGFIYLSVRIKSEAEPLGVFMCVCVCMCVCVHTQACAYMHACVLRDLLKGFDLTQLWELV